MTQLKTVHSDSSPPPAKQPRPPLPPAYQQSGPAQSQVWPGPHPGRFQSSEKLVLFLVTLVVGHCHSVCSWALYHSSCCWVSEWLGPNFHMSLIFLLHFCYKKFYHVYGTLYLSAHPRSVTLLKKYSNKKTLSICQLY